MKVKCYPLIRNGLIEDLLGSIIDIYSLAGSTDGKLLNAALFDDWDIFAVPTDTIQKLIVAICTDRFRKNPELFTTPVIIPESHDKAYLSEYGITRDKSWQEFADALKYQNRFFSSIFNPESLVSFFTYSVKSYPVDSIMYRARICNDEQGYPRDQMGAPPREMRTAGRINPEGVGILYLSSKDTTALYEVRSNLYDYVTVGGFRLLRDIRVVNLAELSSVSPFIYAATNDLLQFAVNRQCIKEIANDIGKPLRRNDSPLEYLPTQIISEFIKSQGYDGVEYSSTMTKDGYNIAVFDGQLFECIDTHVYEITELVYKHQIYPSLQQA